MTRGETVVGEKGEPVIVRTSYRNGTLAGNRAWGVAEGEAATADTLDAGEAEEQSTTFHPCAPQGLKKHAPQKSDEEST